VAVASLSSKHIGHANVKATEIYTHVMEKNLSGVLSPLDGIGN
jgi:site-specific recombinase XerD